MEVDPVLDVVAPRLGTPLSLCLPLTEQGLRREGVCC